MQRAIAKTLPGFAYLPTRPPKGYRYSQHSLGRHGFDLWFSKPGQAPDQLGYHVVKADCGGQGTPMHSFNMNSINVAWSASYEDQQAWRCVKNGRAPSYIVSATRSIPGDDSLTTRKARNDALDLVRLVAYTEQTP